MKKFFALSLLSFSLIACVSATADTSMCKSSVMTFNVPEKYIGVPIPPVSYSVIYDFHSQLNEVDKYGTLTLSTSSFTLYDEASDFGWVSHVSVSIESEKASSLYPKILLADQEVSVSSHEIKLIIIASSEETQKYFTQGPVKFNYTLQGEVPDHLKVSGKLCLSASVDTEKSIPELGK